MGTKGKIILIGIGLIGVGVGGYFAYRHFTKDGGLNVDFNSGQTPDYVPPVTEREPVRSSGGSGGSSTTSGAGFPLKKGSRGELVGELQKALARKFGSAVLGRGGIDRIFGNDTQRALTNNGLPAVVTQRVFEAITERKTGVDKTGFSATEKKKGITVTKPKAIATELRDTIIKGRFDLALNQLAEINTTDDYDLVNTFFKEYITYGVRKTIVTALLQRFKSADDTAKLSSEFKRMGLAQKSSGQWYNPNTLNGLGDGQKIKAINAAKVWNIKRESLTVPPQTILGEFLHATNGVTEFSTLDDKVLFIETKNIAYA